jgi:hypothetical protein
MRNDRNKALPAWRKPCLSHLFLVQLRYSIRLKSNLQGCDLTFCQRKMVPDSFFP